MRKILKTVIIFLLAGVFFGVSNLYVSFELNFPGSTEMSVLVGFPLNHSRYAFEGFPLLEKISRDKPLESHSFNFILDFIFWLIISYLIVWGAEKLIKKLLTFKK